MEEIKKNTQIRGKKERSAVDTKGLQIISFETNKEFRQWLEVNFNNKQGIWIRIYKKDSGIKTINHAEALEEALCFGWIDGQALKYDEISYLQKFTPRRARSTWSKRNIEIIARLEREGKMKPSGITEVEKAKADGRWEKAYDSPINMEMPDDFLHELLKDKKAYAFFETLNKTNKYAIAFRLQTAKKPETRESRKKKILDMLSRGEKFYN